MKLTELLTKIAPLPWRVANESIDKEGRYGFRIESPSSELMVDEWIHTGYTSGDSPDAYVAYVTHSANVLPEVVEALKLALEVIERHDNCRTGCDTRNDQALFGYTGEDNLTDPDGVQSVGDRIVAALAKAENVQP